MENNIENAAELGVEVLDGAQKNHLLWKIASGVAIGAAVIYAGVKCTKYLIKKHHEKKGVIDGEILSVENDLTEE